MPGRFADAYDRYSQMRRKRSASTSAGTKRRYVKPVATLASISPEMKVYDEDFTSIEWSNAGTVLQLNEIPSGTDQGERIGKKIKMAALRIEGWANAYVTGTVYDAQHCQLFLVRDCQPSGASALPAASAILEATNGRSPPNWENFARFKVIKKWSFNLGQTSAGQGIAFHNFDDYIKLGVLAKYKAAGTGSYTDADVDLNGLLLVLCSNKGSGTCPTGVLNTRLFYTDV